MAVTFLVVVAVFTELYLGEREFASVRTQIAFMLAFIWAVVHDVRMMAK